MSWAQFAKEKLSQGQEVNIRPRGHSMRGKVNDGDIMTLVPAKDLTLNVGDVVLVRVAGKDYLHLVKAISGGRCLIGNNRGGINGWVGRQSIFEKAVDIRRPT